jgi:23S rRNA pseudouridine2605 synthase
MEERLQKFMAQCGVASRRRCEDLITSGKVKVNDKLVTELGVKINPSQDRVFVNNKLIMPEEEKVYIALNKPEGYVSTVKDEKNRPTILDIVKVKERIYPIGRLDYNTSGLILLTNDGEVYNKVIHPRSIINKVYIAVIEGHLQNEDIRQFKCGIDIGDYITAPAHIEIIRKFKEKSEVRIIIHEGKNRQIRRMCEHINHPVLSLKRISVGEIGLNGLKTGNWRYLSDQEILYLKQL